MSKEKKKSNGPVIGPPIPCPLEWVEKFKAIGYSLVAAGWDENGNPPYMRFFARPGAKEEKEGKGYYQIPLVKDDYDDQAKRAEKLAELYAKVEKQKTRRTIAVEGNEKEPDKKTRPWR